MRSRAVITGHALRLSWIVTLCLTGPAHGQLVSPRAPRQGDLPSRSATPPYFLVDTTTFLDSEADPGVRVTVSVSFRQLHFTRAPGGGYEAVIDVSEIFYDRKGRQVTGDVWRHRVTASRYRDTGSDRLRFRNSQEFKLAPGKYKLVVRLRSSGTQTESEVLRELEVAPAAGVKFAISGLEIGTCADSLVTPMAAEESGFQLRFNRRFGDPLPHVCARAVLFDALGAEQIVNLTLEVVDGAGQVLEKVEHRHRMPGQRSVVAVGVPAEPLGPGTYRLTLTASRQGVTSTATRDFEIDAGRIDLTRHFGDWVRLATLFLGSEAKELRDVPVAERETRWQAFWRVRDPDPETAENELLDEFVRRVQTSASRYGLRGQAGWATDRGRVFVRFGDPDDIENIARGFNTPAYEIWRYVERNLTFVFADSSGFGDFVLVQPSPPPF